MTNRVLIKRSSVANSVPSAAALEYGEFALNYADGNLFFKNSGNVVTTLASTQFVNVSGNANVGNIGATNAVITNALGASNVTATGNISATYFLGDGSQLTGLSGIQSDFLFANTASSVNPYYQSVYIANYVAGSVATATQSVGGSAVMLAEFLTNAGYPNQSYLPTGTIGITYQTQKASGASIYLTYAEIWKRTAAGAETLLLTSDTTATSAVNTVIQQQASTTNSNNILLDTTDRIAIKIYAQVTSGPTASITLSWDSTTESGFYLTTPPATIAQFIPYQNAVANVNLGSYSITSSYLSVTGNANVGNLGATAVVASDLTGTLLTNAQPHITGVGSLTNLVVQGNIVAGNLDVGDITAGNIEAGNITANYFFGNGSQLSGISTNSISNGNSNVAIASASANVTVGINGDANTVIISPGSIFVNGIFASPKTITSNVQMAADSTAMVISPLTIGPGYSMSVPTSSTVYIWIPS